MNNKMNKTVENAFIEILCEGPPPPPPIYYNSYMTEKI